MFPLQDIFGFTGLYEEWIDKESGELLETYTIITTESNDILKLVHERMFINLKSEDYKQWLDSKENNTERLQNLLIPYSTNEMSPFKDLTK